MPMNRSLYPKDWTSIALQIKTAAGWRCQECDRPCRMPGESESSFLARLSDGEDWAWFYDLEGSSDDEEAKFLFGRFVLTVAHLNHVPSDCRPENLKALCSVCHLRFDGSSSQKAIKRRLKKERLGQMVLVGLEMDYDGSSDAE